MAHLDYVESFIREVYEGGTSDPSSMPRGPLFFREAQGAIALSAGERADVQRGDGSPRGRLLREDAYLPRHAADVRARRPLRELGWRGVGSDDDFESRLSDALDQLGRSLHRPPKDYVCYTPVRGLAVEGLPLRVGEVTLIRMNPHRLRRQPLRCSRPQKERESRTGLSCPRPNRTSWASDGARECDCA